MLEAIVKMWKLEPAMELLADRENDEAYLTAHEGESYVILFTDGGEVGLDLRNYPGVFNGCWINIGSGTWGEQFSLNGGSLNDISTPGSGGWFAVITRE
jgi:hypothetical protein